MYKINVKNSLNTNAGYVYVILCTDNTVKIGKTMNPNKRFKQIECASGKTIEKYYLTEMCANYDDIEYKALKYFKKYNTNGEWFNYDFEKIVRKIKSYKKDYNIKEMNEIDKCVASLKAILLVLDIKRSEYKDYDYMKFKYDFSHWDENIKDINKIKDIIKENIKYNIETHAEELNEELNNYINNINNNINIRDTIQNYCFYNYIDLLEPSIAKEELTKEGIYDLYKRILGIKEIIANDIVDKKKEKFIEDLYAEYDEYVINEALKQVNGETI